MKFEKMPALGVDEEESRNVESPEDVLGKLGEDRATIVEKRVRQAFAAVEDPKGLMGALDKFEGIHGSAQYYDRETLKKIAEEIIAGRLGIEYATNTYGFREAVDQVRRKLREKERAAE